jgi:methyl-accepting chemotaxis protein
MKSIKTKMIVMITLLVITIIAGMTIVTKLNSTMAFHETTSTMLQSMVSQSADLVSNKVSQNLEYVQGIAKRSEISNDSLSKEEKLKSLSDIITEKKYIKVGISDMAGNMIYSNGKTMDASKREYFQLAAKGTANITDPMMSSTEGVIVVIYAVPIMKDGNVIGVMTVTTDSKELSNMVNKVTVGKSGKAFMINATGVKIAHYNNDLVVKMDNDLENVKKDSSLGALVDIEKEMIQGKSGVGEYRYNGDSKTLAYAPVKGTNWSLAIGILQSEVLEQANNLVFKLLILAVLAVILSVIAVYIISSVFSKKLSIATHYMLPMSEGDFTQQVKAKELQSKDEIGQLMNALQHLQDSIKDMFGLVLDNSGRIDEDAKNLSEVSTQMNESVGMVNDAIQDVAQGSAAQAESISSIALNMNHFAESMDQIVADIKDVDSGTMEMKDLSDNSNQNIKGLSESVQITNQTFQTFREQIAALVENLNQINQITKLINDISDQTNLLSLNATIEAARAGEAGRGFGVVADEIRNLSEQSKNSAEKINELIQKISTGNVYIDESSELLNQEFSNQSQVIDATLLSFQEIVVAIQNIIPKIDNVNHSADKMNQKKNEILGELDQISAISQQSSAATEEIGASMEQLFSSSEQIANAASNLGTRTDEMMEGTKRFKL